MSSANAFNLVLSNVFSLSRGGRHKIINSLPNPVVQQWIQRCLRMSYTSKMTCLIWTQHTPYFGGDCSIRAKKVALEKMAIIDTFGPVLTLYHTIPTFNDPGNEAFWKHCRKRRKCWWPAFSPFPTMFSTLPKRNFNFSVAFILLSARSFNLDQSKNLSFGKELTNGRCICYMLDDHRWMNRTR